MAKRFKDRPVDDGEQAFLKRQKISHVTISTEEIKSAKQLQQLLTLDQAFGNLERAKNGIQSFKVFLESLSEEDAKPYRLQILKEFLQSQLPKDEEDNNAVFLASIMQIWSYASQSNHDSMLSAVPAVLALLLRTLSNMIDFAQYGIRLGRTLLQKPQLEFLSRCLSSNKSKDYIISPSLRLIREVASFDGGALIKDVYRSKEYTFKSLARNVGLRYVGDDAENPKKPSVRTNALRFLLTCIKFLPMKAKNELFTLRDVVSGITRDISSDPPYLIMEVLEGLKVYVLQDEGLARESKSKLLHPTNLARIATLYGYDGDDIAIQQGKKAVSTVAHEFLLIACTTPNMGVLYSKAGYYPRGIDPDYSPQSEDPNFIDLGLESLGWADKFTENITVRNTILSEFIQSLRPWSDMKQSELLLAIFKAGPELVADYFFRKKSFSFEPKLTTTWIGYSAFLFSVIQLPVPLYLGRQHKYGKLPPPSSIVIESVLPQPLTPKVLTRCLHQKTPLITFFTVRLLTVAFQKLQSILTQYSEAAETGSTIWVQARYQLVQLFCQRCPSMKDIINNFSNISSNNVLQRQAISKLLVLYYETIPQIAFESKFDVGIRLTETLRLMDDSEMPKEERTIRIMELEDLFEIAHFSPGTRWFHKPESFHISPFVAMLHFSVQASSELPLLKIRRIISSVLNESGIMQVQTRSSSQDALVFALKACKGKERSQAIYDFLDNCALRCSSTPVKYIDSLEQYYNTVYGNEVETKDFQWAPTSLLLVAIAEQWPFIIKSSESKVIYEIANFISNYLAASVKILENKRVIKAISKNIEAVCAEGSEAKEVIEGYRKVVDAMDIPEPPETSSKSVETHEIPPLEGNTIADIEISMLRISDMDVDDHSALTRWISKEIEEVIEEGHTAALIMLLCSQHLSARKEAMSNLAKLALKLKCSSYNEREQIWLLISELMETAKPYISEQPIPTTISAFASHALSVLRDPLHCLYPKVNTFLSQGPTWEVDKLPLLHVILNEPPTLDDAHYAEVSFLLGYLSSGLRTSEDMAIFHKRHVLEKLLTFYNNPYLGKNLKDKILRILWRATTVEGGSTTLITRLSILTWLRAQMGLESGNNGLRALMDRLLKSCDGEKLKAWSGRTVAEFFAELE